MRQNHRLHLSGLAVCFLVCLVVLGRQAAVLGQQPSPHAHPPAPGAQGPVHITMEALHRHGGVPPGWQFTLPQGDATAGREVFITMQCYTCHQIQGELFPKYPPRDIGPDLTGMGAHHPAAYFAESIIAPNAVVVTGDGYTATDGRSRMPTYNEALTIAQLLDLVAYLTSLQGPMPLEHMGHGHHPAPGHSQTK